MGWMDKETGAGLEYLKPASARSYVCLVIDQGLLSAAHVARLREMATADAHLCLLAVSHPAGLRAGWQAASIRRVSGRSKARHEVELALALLPRRCQLLVLGAGGREAPLWLGGVMGHPVQPLPMPEGLPVDALAGLIEPGIAHCLREALTGDPEFAYLRG